MWINGFEISLHTVLHNVLSTDNYGYDFLVVRILYIENVINLLHKRMNTSFLLFSAVVQFIIYMLMMKMRQRHHLLANRFLRIQLL